MPARPSPAVSRLIRTPVVFDAEAGARNLNALLESNSALTEIAADVHGSGFLRAVFSCSPYLARTSRLRSDLFPGVLDGAPGDVLAEAIANVAAAGEDSSNTSELMAALRKAKQAVHLTTAIADLSGVWPLAKVTRALTAFADACVQCALQALVRFETQRGRLHQADDDASGPLPGYFVLALGKQGAHELNYSSDVDLIVCYDRDRLPDRLGRDPAQFCIRLTQSIIRVLQDVTGDGYVFRVDLRLRPDPASSAVATSTAGALRYYESLGQNWERAAMIKARPCAGDRGAGEAFLTELAPFVWRRSLDYAALADISAMFDQVRLRAPGDISEGVDIKRSAGGIREIELFAQTQQLIFGGRDQALRVRGTCETLSVLASRGYVGNDVSDELRDHYESWRSLEHRLQMIDDQQTHTVPADVTRRGAVTALCGHTSHGEFDQIIDRAQKRVRELCSDLYPQREVGASLGEDAALDRDSLVRLGFAKPDAVLACVNEWRSGKVTPTRTLRARTLFEHVVPVVLDAVASTGEADLAFVRFASFFERLPAGVQILSLLDSEPQLLRDVIAILALAPRLGSTLARQPAILDIMLDPAFLQPFSNDSDHRLASLLNASVTAAQSFESALNGARRIGREEMFRIGAQTLLGRADAADAGAAYATLADGLITALASAAHDEVQRRHGDIDGGFVVIGLGSLGGRELAANSDLDMMIVYDGSAEVSDGARPLPADAYFARIAQRLIAALSAPTEEGNLYDVDMQLRPSGSAGPIAVSLAAFDAYYERDAWTWEMMALTRARTVAGPQYLTQEISNRLARIMRRARDPGRTAIDVLDMRGRLEQEKPARGGWDLKRAPGGLVDIDFVAQYLQLISANDWPGVLAPGTGDALRLLQEAGVLEPDDADVLTAAARLQHDLSQVLQVCYEGVFVPASASPQLRRLLTTAGGEADFDALQTKLTNLQQSARAVCDRVLAQGAELGATE